MEKRKKRIFKALRQQLINEVMFVKNVSKSYYDAPNNLDIVDFEYRGMPCKLVLNGKLMLKTKTSESRIDSYQDLLSGLIQSNYPKKKVA